MKRRLSFAAPFVITIACGGPRRDPTEVRDPEPMRDIAQPEYELVVDAPMPDAPPDAAPDAAVPPVTVTPAWEPPRCSFPGNPPSHRACKAYRIINVFVSGAAVRITFIGGTKVGMKKGQPVVVANTSITSTIDECRPTSCTATLRATMDQIKAHPEVYVITDE